MRTLIAITLLVASAAAQDKNQWRVLPTPPPRPVTFWTARDWQQPPLRTNRQTLRSPWFWGTHALATAATIVDYRRQHGRQDWADAFVPLIAASATDYASDRLLWRPFNVAGVGYLIVRHSYGAASGNYP